MSKYMCDCVGCRLQAEWYEINIFGYGRARNVDFMKLSCQNEKNGGGNQINWWYSRGWISFRTAVSHNGSRIFQIFVLAILSEDMDCIMCQIYIYIYIYFLNALFSWHSSVWQATSEIGTVSHRHRAKAIRFITAKRNADTLKYARISQHMKCLIAILIIHWWAFGLCAAHH